MFPSRLQDKPSFILWHGEGLRRGKKQTNKFVQTHWQLLRYTLQFQRSCISNFQNPGVPPQLQKTPKTSLATCSYYKSSTLISASNGCLETNPFVSQPEGEEAREREREKVCLTMLLWMSFIYSYTARPQWGHSAPLVWNSLLFILQLLPKLWIHYEPSCPFYLSHSTEM